jgi:hypothetical protein
MRDCELPSMYPRGGSAQDMAIEPHGTEALRNRRSGQLKNN